VSVSPVDLHREVLERAQGDDREAALSTAQRFLDLFSSSEDPEVRELTAGVTATWLSLKVNLEPDDALPLCDEVFARYEIASGVVAAVVATVALRLKVEALLKSADDTRVSAAVGELVDFFESRSTVDDAVQPAQQLIAAAKTLSHEHQYSLAVAVLRPVVDQLDVSQEPTAHQLAAVAQLWLLLAVLLDDADLPTRERELEALEAFGDDWIKAVDRLLRELNGQHGWRPQIVLLISMRIEWLEHAGRTDEARAAQTDFIETFEGKWRDIPAVSQLVDRYRDQLADE
jgi:hypothetical protein